MRNMRWMLVVGAFVVAMPTGPANAASPKASSPGQELSALAPLLGAELGGFISFEARHPELEGRRNFGVEVSEFAHADRTNCPAE
jgi:hypothetical protein